MYLLLTQLFQLFLTNFKVWGVKKLASDLGDVRFLTVDIFTLKGTDKPNARDVQKMNPLHWIPF